MISESSLQRLALVELNLLELTKNGYTELKLNGHCMWPVVRDRDLVKIEKFPYQNLKFGDVAIFQTTPETFHANILFRTLKESELKNPPENYVGKITGIKRNGENHTPDNRSRLQRFWQAALCPSNPYGLGLPKTLFRKLKWLFH